MTLVTLSPARSLVVAPRLPSAPTNRGAGPWDAFGDVVIDCDVPGCGYHAMGPRGLIGKAYRDHYRQHHASTGEVGVVLINHPRQ